MSDEDLGGDPACWAHLFEEDEDGEVAPDRDATADPEDGEPAD